MHRSFPAAGVRRLWSLNEELSLLDHVRPNFVFLSEVGVDGFEQIVLLCDAAFGGRQPVSEAGIAVFEVAKVASPLAIHSLDIEHVTELESDYSDEDERKAD
jgi:hypothetical protein